MNKITFAASFAFLFISFIGFSQNERIEFKQKFCKEVIETVVAFSNSKGGNIYIGIDDLGNIVGTEIGTETVSEWYNQIKQTTEPSVLVDFEIKNFKDLVILG